MQEFAHESDPADDIVQSCLFFLVKPLLIADPKVEELQLPISGTG